MTKLLSIIWSIIEACLKNGRYKTFLFLLILPAVDVLGCPDKTELPVIQKAAERNNCCGDDFIILLAVRMAENGPEGTEFGVLHPRAIDTDLDTQAGWAAATVVKNRIRYNQQKRKEDFIEFLADRYCPPSVDPEGNRNWKKNVKFYVRKFRNAL